MSITCEMESAYYSPILSSFNMKQGAGQLNFKLKCQNVNTRPLGHIAMPFQTKVC